jgi:hypothetical protein
MDIFSVRDVPFDGVTTYATLGLSDISIDLFYEGLPLRVEFVLPLLTAHDEGMDSLATCAFIIMNDTLTPRPGAILPHVFDLYRPDRILKHVLLASPFLWDLETQEFSSKVVAWLQAVPISEAERSYAIEHGSDALEDILESEAVEVTNLDRPSVL